MCLHREYIAKPDGAIADGKDVWCHTNTVKDIKFFGILHNNSWNDRLFFFAKFLIYS
ncbi:MAG: hypothetical protein UW30_C0026G0012 [Candidatus Giovannonibacteria bacterium GW2011_GWA2_44_13b]|uniref:Uncharacterized protein n=1 Tax=Candidatus Giovannonibacteria bacterium GW2011_GWA2_44_13b TaxID=1618647 RepID=A0A0G1H0F3_9BACT|nr:MAG: hypothetical protein UW30_C0026G0012 [Candidatus Giovannonibacteria bacterium GW2011_GWA2_44_13b]